MLARRNTGIGPDFSQNRAGPVVLGSAPARPHTTVHFLEVDNCGYVDMRRGHMGPDKTRAQTHLSLPDPPHANAALPSDRPRPPADPHRRSPRPAPLS